MDATDRPVLVDSTALDDLLELVERALTMLPSHDPITAALRGAVAEIRCHSVLEPSLSSL